MRHVSKLILMLTACLTLASICWADQAKHDESINRMLHSNPNDAQKVPVIIQTDTAPDDDHDGKINSQGGNVKKRFTILNAIAADLPLNALDRLSDNPRITRISFDHTVRMHNDITAAAVGADIARTDFAVDGTGITVAVIDSGINIASTDLAGRVLARVDYTNSTILDAYGHGTHVAGIIGGNGYNSQLGTRNFKGVAPNVNFVDLRVLDSTGAGTVTNTISAIQWAVTNKALYNIKVINLSLGHSPAESYVTDPLDIACANAVSAGITVVVAAGNLGKNSLGQPVYGGITSPGNSPAVITVGAMKTMGTYTRTDDTIATYSSRGPTYIDYLAKPDLVAPGNHISSVNDKLSTIDTTYTSLEVPGSYYGLLTNPADYLFLSGTSMAAPVVSGTVALMLQVNPTLRPNTIKGVLMYTAEWRADLDAMTQGAGYLNVHGALNLADHISRVPVLRNNYWIVPGRLLLQTKDTIQGLDVVWGGAVIWGANKVTGSTLYYNVQAWDDNVVWGGNVVWGADIVWGGSVVASTSTIWSNNVVWGTSTFAGDSIFTIAGSTQMGDPNP